jgi:hypothetical protein
VRIADLRLHQDGCSNFDLIPLRTGHANGFWDCVSCGAHAGRRLVALLDSIVPILLAETKVSCMT